MDKSCFLKSAFPGCNAEVTTDVLSILVVYGVLLTDFFLWGGRSLVVEIIPSDAQGRKGGRFMILDNESKIS